MNSSYNRSRGSVLIETAWVLPLLLIFLIGVIDVSAVLQEHQRVANISYEGARYGASVIGLPEEHQANHFNGPRHKQIENRVQRLLDEHSYDANTRVVTVQYIPADQAVRVSVEVDYRTFFSGPLAAINLNRVRVSKTAPYLYPDQP